MNDLIEQNVRAVAVDPDARPPGQVALSVFTILFAIVVGLSLALATASGLFCTTISQPSGANVGKAGAIVILSGLAGLIVTVIAKNVPRVLSAVLLGQAAMLSLAIGLVARDSATVRTTTDCGFFDSSNVSTSTHHVTYAYGLLGVAIVVLLTQAFRGSGRPRHATGVIAGVVSAALLVAVLPGRAGSSAAARPSHGVLVCKALAPKAHGDPHCKPRADVGRAPIRPPDGLMCATVLRGVRGKMIGIRAFYDGKLFRHADVRSSASETSPFVYFDGSYLHPVAAGARLPTGRYRCTFLVSGKVVHSRTIAVVRQ